MVEVLVVAVFMAELLDESPRAAGLPATAGPPALNAIDVGATVLGAIYLLSVSDAVGRQRIGYGRAIK